MKPIRSILCPTDFSECAHEALGEAIGLAQRFEASLTLMHVYHLPAYLYSEATMPYSDEITKAAEATAKRDLGKLRAEAEHQLGRPVTVKVQLGSSYTDIVEEARKGQYDLIVMGTHGRTGIKHFVIGSVAERVVQLAPCRVLTVRGQP